MKLVTRTARHAATPATEDDFPKDVHPDDQFTLGTVVAIAIGAAIIGGLLLDVSQPGLVAQLLQVTVTSISDTPENIEGLDPNFHSSRVTLWKLVKDSKKRECREAAAMRLSRKPEFWTIDQASLGLKSDVESLRATALEILISNSKKVDPLVLRQNLPSAERYLERRAYLISMAKLNRELCFSICAEDLRSSSWRLRLAAAFALGSMYRESRDAKIIQLLIQFAGAKNIDKFIVRNFDICDDIVINNLGEFEKALSAKSLSKRRRQVVQVAVTSACLSNISSATCPVAAKVYVRKHFLPILLEVLQVIQDLDNDPKKSLAKTTTRKLFWSLRRSLLREVDDLPQTAITIVFDKTLRFSDPAQSLKDCWLYYVIEHNDYYSAAKTTKIQKALINCRHDTALHLSLQLSSRKPSKLAKSIALAHAKALKVALNSEKQCLRYLKALRILTQFYKNEIPEQSRTKLCLKKAQIDQLPINAKFKAQIRNAQSNLIHSK